MINKFTSHTGVAAPLNIANVDTDTIVPKQFLKRITKTGFGEFLFYDWRYKDGKPIKEFVLNQQQYEDSTILVAGKNFGCGSSREHAPWALRDYGFRSILAPSFADIFYNNCFKNGILPVVLPEEKLNTLFQRAQGWSYQLTVNLEMQTVSDNVDFKAAFTVDSYRKTLLLQGLDEVGSTLLHQEKITQFEKDHTHFYTIPKA